MTEMLKLSVVLLSPCEVGQRSRTPTRADVQVHIPACPCLQLPSPEDDTYCISQLLLSALLLHHQAVSPSEQKRRNAAQKPKRPNSIWKLWLIKVNVFAVSGVFKMVKIRYVFDLL